MKNLRDILLIIFLVILDQLTKFYFFGKNIYVFNFFSFRYVPNTGSSFGFFSGNNLIFIFITVFIIGVILFYYSREKNFNFAFDFLLAGGFGNLMDRTFRGYVVDFIDFKFWYVFNLADLFITLGVLLLLYYSIKEKD